MTIQKAFILTGVPASGKSTYRAELLERYPDAFVYSSDDYIDAKALSLGSTFDAIFWDTIKEATAFIDKQIIEAVNLVRPIIFDRTNLTKKVRGNMMVKLSVQYEAESYCVLPPGNEAEYVELKRRLNSRVGKSIPSHVMASMIDSFQLPTLDDGFMSVTYVDLWGKEIMT